MAAGGSRTIKIRVDGDASGLNDFADKGERGLRRVSAGFVAMGVAAGAALVAASRAVFDFAKDSVSAFVEAQSAQTRLTDAYARFPKTANLSIEALRAYNEQLALKTRFDDDAFASGEAVLAQFGLTGKQLRDTAPLLADFAAKTGRELPDAATTLGKAFLGNTKALKELGINYKSTGNQAKDVANITAILRKQVGGFAEEEGKTAAGQAAILKNEFNEVQERIGAFLLPVLVTLGNWLINVGIPALDQFATWFIDHIVPAVSAVWSWIQANLLPVLQTLASFVTGTLVPALSSVVTWLTQNWSWLQVVAAAVAGAVAGWLVYTTITKAWTTATELATAAQAALNLVLNANPIGIVIIAVGALVAAFIVLWNKSAAFRDFFIGAWEGIKTAAQLAVSWIVDKWNGLVTAFQDTVHFFGEIGTKIGDAITSGIKAGINFVIGLLNGFISGVNFLIRGVNAISPFGDIPSIPSIPRLARGGVIARAGWAEVGERGRELVRLPAGAQVFPKNQSDAMMAGAGGGVTVRVYIGDTELRGIVRSEVDDANDETSRDLHAGVGGAR